MATRKHVIRASTSGAHIRTLIVLFITWKILLLCIACASPGVGYDTSSRLMLPSESADESILTRVSHRLTSRLVRWDAVYLIRVAQRDYLFEQEWAFSWGFTRLVAFVARVLFPATPTPPLPAVALIGIVVAHLAHLLSVILLFTLTLSIIPNQYPQQRTCAFLAAALHVISPAGIFLSAPYSESLFSCLNFLGMLFYSRSFAARSEKQSATYVSSAILGSGLCWGLAATVRGNGILSGIVLAYRCLTLLKSLPRVTSLRTLIVTVVAGLFVALGSVLPQWSAYQEYCSGSTLSYSPAWCSRLPPSIFNWVQERYWNVGFLRYWTLSNVPLFIIAIPVLCLMLSTALISYFEPALLLSLQLASPSNDPSSKSVLSTLKDEQRYATCMRSFALPQAVLGLLTLTNFHVQIINRISSGYPIWYIVLAILFTARNTDTAAAGPRHGVGKLVSLLCKRQVHSWVFKGMTLYALVQCGLYASFLPPA